MPSLSRRTQTTAKSLQVGSWTCVERLGVGRWCNVYAARPATRPSDWPSDYAVKVAQREIGLAQQMLAREGQVAATVTHPRVVSILSIDLAHDPAHLVMPIVGRCPLEALVEHFPLPLTQSLWLTRQVAQGLRALHSTGWIHSDIQPSNLVISNDGLLTIVDLGLARSGAHRGLAPAVVAGRLPYIAPEMFSSALTNEPRSDIYSLGVVLYQLISGRLPFDVSQPEDWVVANLEQRPIDVREFAPNLNYQLFELIHQMLAKQPLRRPTAAEMVERLTKAEIMQLPRVG